MLALLTLAATVLFTGSVAVDTKNSDLINTLSARGVNIHNLLSDETFSTPPCTQLCTILPSLFPNQTISPGTTAYTTWKTSFWSQQQSQVQPACIFQPSNSKQVSTGLLLARVMNCAFAVKSGGHAAFAGSSNIQNGLTVDLSRLNSWRLSADGRTAYVGTGNRWVDVYTWLEGYGLAVVGGRVADIGVGGLILGGGISFFSGLYGWACDNVNNYEVVIADGTILQVNPTSHADLYWSLRGGGNNFGIVTRFDLSTFPQGMMWGGSRTYMIDKQADLINAFVGYAQDQETSPDLNAALIMAVAYAQGTFLTVTDLEYARPLTNPEIFHSFLDIPAVADTIGIKSLSNITLEFKSVNPSGLRESYWTATFKPDTNLITYIVNLFKTSILALQNHTSGTIIPSATFQIISTDMLTQMTKKGGNALGLHPSDGPLLLFQLSPMWQNEKDDADIMRVMSEIISRSIAYAKARDLYNGYMYMNYASQYQDVIGSYGAGNKGRLKQVSGRYDPDSVFQRLEPGYFKLGGMSDISLPSSP